MRASPLLRSVLRRREPPQRNCFTATQVSHHRNCLAKRALTSRYGMASLRTFEVKLIVQFLVESIKQEISQGESSPPKGLIIYSAQSDWAS